MMHSEINAAVQFMAQFLYEKLPRRKVNLFLEQLANNLVLRCDGWNPADRIKNAEHRRILIKVCGQVDTLISVTAASVGLNIEEVLQHLPGYLCCIMHY